MSDAAGQGPGEWKWQGRPIFACGRRRCAATALFVYGLLNVGAWVKLTPVYTAAECGDISPALERLSIGDPIDVSLVVAVTCWNPNVYAVQVMTAHPGRVWVGNHREMLIGNMTLVEGCSLPDKGTGTLRVRMDTKLTADQSGELLPRFLRDPQVPVFLELQFDVGVFFSFGGFSQSITAPFKKVCGMNIGGVLNVHMANKIGPMICRNTFDEVEAQLPKTSEATRGMMSFSAAQMDPQRIRMGEIAKNIGIIGIALCSFGYGILLLYRDFYQPDPPATDDATDGQASGWRFSKWYQLVRGEAEAPPPKEEPKSLGRQLLSLLSCGLYGSKAAAEAAAAKKALAQAEADRSAGGFRQLVLWLTPRASQEPAPPPPVQPRWGYTLGTQADP